MSRSSLFRRLGGALSLVLVMTLLAGCGLPGMMKPSKPEPAKPAPVKGTTVALVVPRNAAQGAVNALIQGARIGAQSQAGTKQPARVTVIYSDGDRRTQRAALPERSVVGMLMLSGEGTYRQMKNAGVMDKRVVFCFMKHLPDGDEGATAWRFYPSNADQVEAVAELVVGQLGIRSAASFGPEDEYSLGMVGELEQNLASRGVVLQRITAVGSSATWGELLKPYVNPETNETNGTLKPNTPFEAVFLTDSWRRLQSVVTAFGSNGEDRLLMAGTMLWDGYNVHGSQNASKYGLVTWPSAYLPTRAPAALAGSKANTFWGALGYDFVRFAARLQIDGRPSATVVNRAARQVAAMPFIMAPIRYDGSGRATQKLFMVQVGAAGTQVADPSVLRAALDRARENVENRASVPADQARIGIAPGAAGSSDAPIMRAGPNSSYRLSLPGVAR